MRRPSQTFKQNFFSYQSSFQGHAATSALHHLIKLALQDGRALQRPTNPRKLNSGRCEASVEESAQNARDGHAPTSPEVPATHAISPTPELQETARHKRSARRELSREDSSTTRPTASIYAIRKPGEAEKINVSLRFQQVRDLRAT